MMAWQLRVLASVAENQSSVPRTLVQKLTTTHNSSSRRSGAFPDSFSVETHTCGKHMYRHIHISKNLKNKGWKAIEGNIHHQLVVYTHTLL